MKSCEMAYLKFGQAPEWPRHIRGLLPLLRSRPGGVRSREIARLPEPDKRNLYAGWRPTNIPSSSAVSIRFFKEWRRGWDSNPRYGFPYTAFPVLPVKPLLHLSTTENDE